MKKTMMAVMAVVAMMSWSVMAEDAAPGTTAVKAPVACPTAATVNCPVTLQKMIDEKTALLAKETDEAKKAALQKEIDELKAKLATLKPAAPAAGCKPGCTSPCCAKKAAPATH